MIPPVLQMAREQFFEEWRGALKDLTDDEARDFVLHVKQMMTEMALRHATRTITVREIPTTAVVRDQWTPKTLMDACMHIRSLEAEREIFRQEASRFARLLAAPDQSVTGWKLVPITPTAEMLDAMETDHDYRFEVAETYGSIGIPKAKCAEIYQAMIEAAPEYADNAE